MWRWRACGLALLLTGCTDSGLSPALTEFMIMAHAQDAKLLVEVGAYDLATIPAYLIGDATVSAKFRGQTIALPLTAYGPYAYDAAIDLTDPLVADEPIAVTVSHGDTTETVTNTMPPDFTLVQPADTKVGAPVDLAWSPTANDPMTWSGSCGTGFDGPVPTDMGMLEFPAEVFGSSPIYGCSAELTMTRERTASPAGEFVILFTAEQQHTVDFQIKP